MGGGETALLDFLELFLQDEFIEPILLCPAGPFADRAQALGVKWFDFEPQACWAAYKANLPKPLKLFYKPYYILSASKRLSSSIEQIKNAASASGADILHGFTHFDAYTTMLAARQQQTPFVLTIHSECAGTAEILTAYRHASRVIVVSDWMKNQINRKKQFDDKMVKIGAGVNQTHFKKIAPDPSFRTQFNLPADSPLIGLIARIVDWKRQDILITAAAEVIKTHPSARFLIVGGGHDYWDTGKAYYDSLLALVNEYNLQEHVIFTGEISDIPQVLANLSLFVNVSQRETYGRSIAEAMSMGLPVICADAGAVSELVEHEQNGLLIPYDDAGSLAQAITHLLDNPDYANNLGRKAQETITMHHRVETIVQRYKEIYQNILSTDSTHSGN